MYSSNIEDMLIGAYGTNTMLMAEAEDAFDWKLVVLNIGFFIALCSILSIVLIIFVVVSVMKLIAKESINARITNDSDSSIEYRATLLPVNIAIPDWNSYGAKTGEKEKPVGRRFKVKKGKHSIIPLLNDFDSSINYSVLFEVVGNPNAPITGEIVYKNKSYSRESGVGYVSCEVPGKLIEQYIEDQSKKFTNRSIR